MRIAIAILSTLIVTLYWDLSFALPTKTQAEIRASLITKDNVAQYLEAQRQKKALESNNPILPEPFVVTTSLNIREKNSPNTRNSRTWFDKEDGAIVIEGQRYDILLELVLIN